MERHSGRSFGSQQSPPYPRRPKRHTWRPFRDIPRASSCYWHYNCDTLRKLFTVHQVWMPKRSTLEVNSTLEGRTSRTLMENLTPVHFGHFFPRAWYVAVYDWEGVGIIFWKSPSTLAQSRYFFRPRVYALLPKSTINIWAEDAS